MLKIYTGPFRDDCYDNMTRTLQEHKKVEWFRDPFIQEMIKSIDNAEVMVDEVMKSAYDGHYFMSDKLSSGCKALILMYKTNLHLYGTRCGDNCVPYILKIAKDKDVLITLHHCMDFPVSGWEAEMIESGKLVTTADEFVDEYYRLRKENREWLR